MDRVSNISVGKFLEIKKREEHLRNKCENKVDKEKWIKNVIKLPIVNGLKPSLEQSFQKTIHPIGHAKNKKCLLCPNFSFISVKEIRDHMKAKHDINKSKTCQMCFYIFQSKWAVTEHVCHMQKPKKAKYKRHCSDLVVLKKNANEISSCLHWSVHEYKKIYECNFCDFSCSKMTVLFAHNMTFHEGRKPIEKPHPMDKLSLQVILDIFISSFPPLPPMLSPIHETPQESLHLNFLLDSHMKNPSIFSGSPRVENQKNTSPNQDSGFGSGISASESTDSETLINASLGNIIHYQISNQSLLASIFNQKEAALANLGKIDHQQIENQKLLDSIFNKKRLY